MGVETYVSRCHKTVAQFIAIRPIVDLCLEVERHPGSRVARRWREQDGLYLEVMSTEAREAERTEEEEKTDGTVTETD